MNLEFWRSINYLFQDLIVLQLCLVTGYVFFIKKNITSKLSPIYYYLVGNVVIEVISKIMLKIDENSIYFLYLSFIYIPLEVIMLYWFLRNILPNNKLLKGSMIVNFITVTSFSVYESLQYEPNSRDVSFVSAVLNSILLLFVLYELNVQFRGKKMYKTPEVIICFSFLMIFSILTLFYFIMPKLIDYSKILANQFFIFKHIINIIFYLILGYALNQKNKIIQK